MAGRIIQVEERVPLLKGISLSIQHTFAMFSASVLVPWLFGINAAIVLLMNEFCFYFSHSATYQ